MAFTFVCPQCQTKLRTAAPVPTGKAIQCPKCKSVFSAGAAEEEEAAAAPRHPTAKAPASRKRYRDDDDPPRSRHDDDDYDDEPRARHRSRAEDDYDDADDEREEDYGEPRKRKKKKKSGNKALFLTLMALLGLAVIGGGIFLLISLLGGSSADNEVLAFAPADSKFVAVANLGTLMENEKLKGPIGQLLQNPQVGEFRGILQQAGLSENDFSKVMFCGSNLNPGFGQVPDIIAVVLLKKDKLFDREKLKSTAKAQEVQKDGKSYLKAKEFSLYLPSDKLAVVASSEAALAKVINKNDNEVVITGPLRELVDKSNGSTLWGAVSTEEFAKNLGAGKAAIPGGMGNTLAASKAIGLWCDIGSNSMSLSVAILCGNAEDASKGVDAINALIKMIGEKGSARSSGNMLIVSGSGSIDEAVQGFQQGLAMGGAFGKNPFGGLGGAPKIGGGNQGPPKKGRGNPFGGPGKANQPQPPAGGPQVVPAPGPGGGIVLPM